MSVFLLAYMGSIFYIPGSGLVHHLLPLLPPFLTQQHPKEAVLTTDTSIRRRSAQCTLEYKRNVAQATCVS